MTEELITTCLYCGATHEVHTHEGEAGAPQPGMVQICFHCGYTSLYGPDLQLVPLTADQQEELEANPRYRKAITVLRIAKALEDAEKRRLARKSPHRRWDD